MKHVERKVWLTDDLGGAGEATTVRFGIEGRLYEVDLNKRNHETFVRRFKPYVDNGRDVTPEEDAESNVRREARAWAIATGRMPESKRGRLSVALLEEYVEVRDK